MQWPCVELALVWFLRPTGCLLGFAIQPKKEVGESSNASAKRGRGRPPKFGRGGGGRERGRGRGHIAGGDAAVAAVDGNRSPSPARSESPFFGSWVEFPISKFILMLYEPIQRIQWLPRAVADALEGEGPFRFFLHRVGARQGPWEVLTRVVTSQEGGEVHRRAEFFSDWRAFAHHSSFPAEAPGWGPLRQGLRRLLVPQGVGGER